MKKILFIAVLSWIYLSLEAQQKPDLFKEDSIRHKELQEVTVTGQHRPQSVKNSVFQVKIINKERIQRQAATKLQDVLNNELNIRFSQDLATGGSDINMLGLSGQNVKILIDGAPMVGRQGTSNEININQIDINSIERIEIIEGPLSVVYGADALAGVINIITKKPNGQKLSVTARLHEETAGKEY
ncbi:MAG: TonB-dependent receptor plug domain-containing protein, partial [Actinobacteria bacterium]|nr:TonB-dependent receptor plug domain-containing protein [Actinomycetota bacterium]